MRIEQLVLKMQISRNLVIPRQSDGRKLIFTYSFLEIQEFAIVLYFQRISCYSWGVMIFGNHKIQSFSVHVNQSVLKQF